MVVKIIKSIKKSHLVNQQKNMSNFVIEINADKQLNCHCLL